MSIVEISIRTRQSRSGLTHPGDIIEAHPPSRGIGLAAMRSFLWLWVDVSPISSGLLLNESYGQHKRRYYIPLDLLARRFPSLDMGRAVDPSQIYQPFIDVDRRTGLWKSIPNAIPAQDLIIDKTTGKLIYA